MRRWFARLPIHRKLVAMALVVTAAALVLATTGLILLDLWRYRETALGDTAALAEVIAENTAAAVTFNDSAAAAGSLSTVRVRPTVQARLSVSPGWCACSPASSVHLSSCVLRPGPLSSPGR